MLRIAWVIAVGLLVAAAGTMCPAADWQWPSQMSIAGFSVVDVRGSVNADGSGNAVGTLQIPSVGNQRISLVRSVKGEITGNATISVKLGGIEIAGSFVLDTTGLKGKGTVKSSPKGILDASIIFDTRGQASGTGRMELGGINVPVKFTISGSSFTASGSVPARARTDTPLAVYEFSGELKLDVGSGKITVATAKGSVKRTGKLSNQVSTQSVADAPVNLADGTAKTNVGGVSVTFGFFKP